MIDLDLAGKRAVVTGASLGIGAAVVKELADMGAVSYTHLTLPTTPYV